MTVTLKLFHLKLLNIQLLQKPNLATIVLLDPRAFQQYAGLHHAYSLSANGS